MVLAALEHRLKSSHRLVLAQRLQAEDRFLGHVRVDRQKNLLVFAQSHLHS
jgi:hypothetical protein